MCTEDSYFSSVLALSTAFLESIFVTIIGYGGVSPFLCQFYHSSVKVFTDVNYQIFLENSPVR